MKKLAFLSLFLLISILVKAQVDEVRGTVFDSQKNSLSGISVTVKGTTVSTLTYSDGTYAINAEIGNVLVFTLSNGNYKEVAITSNLLDKSGNFYRADVEFNADNQLFNLSLEQLMNIEITTASNISEKLTDAPATTIVLTQKDLQVRGYIQLSDIFNDLPGMDIVRTYGDTYYKNYWRGFRNSVGSPYLFMVDGMIENQLYTNTDQIMAAVPMSNVDRIEIVYGPASSVYGANALMGVINVITKKITDTDGVHLNFQTFHSPKDYFTGDYSVLFQKNNVRFSITGRVENGNVNEFINGNDFYWTRNEHYANATLWGDVVNNSNLGGSFSSPERNRALDFRVYLDDLEFGANFYNLSTGYGMAYPADRVQNVNRWPQAELGLYSRYSKRINDKLSSRTLMRYRSSDITNDALFIEAYNSVNTSSVDSTIAGVNVMPGDSVRGIDFSTWSTYNSSIAVFQDFDVNISSSISLTLGFKYENKNLERLYNVNYSQYVAPSKLIDASLLYPPTSPNVDRYNNRVFMVDKAAYFQGKCRLNENHIFNFGARYDYNSQYGGSPTVRLGYIGRFNRLTAKILYGQAYQEPIMRNLYGGWTGSGSNANLKPERSQTSEASISYTNDKVSGLISCYYVNNTNTIVGDSQSAKNLGKRNIAGVDIHFITHITQNLLKQLQVWAYYSTIFVDDEKKFDANGVKIGNGRIGDLAHQKVYFGITADFGEHVTLNLRGRIVGERETIVTNPIKKIPAYFTLDGNLSVNDIFCKGFNIDLKVVNITDAIYYHPGIREADSGEDPGHWNSNGLGWSGSQGWYNSKLPQPRFFTMLGITLNF